MSVNTHILAFVELYANPELPTLHIQYKDYAVLQEDFNNGDTYKMQEAYCLKQREGELPVLDLRAAYTRPSVPDLAFDRVSCKLVQALLRRACRQALRTRFISCLKKRLSATKTARLSRITGSHGRTVS
ncbi:hypothetical protein I9X38_06705 [Bacillus mojavensis]|nr:hypothetical protein I9X38_06705 [Bacillus mojavensis]